MLGGDGTRGQTMSAAKTPTAPLVIERRRGHAVLPCECSGCDFSTSGVRLALAVLALGVLGMLGMLGMLGALGMLALLESAMCTAPLQ